MQTRAAVFSENSLVLGRFEVAGRVLAIEVSHLREVVRFQPATPLPNAPALIEGVVDLRGALVPLVDLGRALGGSPVEPGVRARIAVVEVDGLVTGLAVDAALDVISVDVADLQDPPALAARSGYEVARAVVRRAGAEPIPVLSLEWLLEAVYRSSLAGVEEAT